MPPIVCISPIDWDFLWQQQQILMSGFARRGARVAFVEPVDAGRPIRVHDWRRVLRRLRNLGRQAGTSGRTVSGVRIITPATVPWRRARWLNRHLVLPPLAERLKRLGFEAPVVWTFSAAPNATWLRRLLSPRLLIYHCVNRVRGYPYASQELIRAEEELTREADLVFADARILWEEKQALNRECFRLPPGVDFPRFAPSSSRRVPGLLRRLPRPRLGYFGNIDDRLDQEALARFAATHPSWSVVLIGPVAVDVSRLRRLSNVALPGPVAHGDLGSWLQGLDVLAIPYRPGEFTRGILPGKLFESLATGKPVVAMGLPELAPYADMVRCCPPERFAVTAELALEEDTPERREARIGLARENSWDARVDGAWHRVEAAWVAKSESRT